MSATDRQNRLLVTEDWVKIYQSYRNADFESYDFENLRRIMIDYIRQNYPENFNDYIESSEYMALVDLMAFMGQSIAFRIDLNSRENFLELAERRDSVLRLSRLISYNAKRNIAASGLLKFTSVQTTETVLDSNGRNLSGQVITWNDSSNSNWYDQFINVINSAFPTSQQFGNPVDKNTIYGIPTEQYRFSGYNVDVPIYGFTKTVSGRNMNFEITSTTFKGQSYIYEEAPIAGNKLACIFRDDGKGASSSNTGFFLRFTQGSLNNGSFTITQPTAHESVNVDTIGINDNDVWLYDLDKSGNESTLWTKVSSFEGNNIIYNSLNKGIKTIYNVLTRASDAVSLSFSDGTFGKLPLGTFKLYYRTSNGLTYKISPTDIRNIAISIPYTSNSGKSETLTLTLALATSVSNSAPAETNDSIKYSAPQSYYTQNRMVTGEDYNISPLTVNQQILKVKSINRASSGISRYFELTDPTGKYSSTNLFADDGVLYLENYTTTKNLTYTTKNSIIGSIYSTVFDILGKIELRNFYYSQYKVKVSPDINVLWINELSDSNSSTGNVHSFTYDPIMLTIIADSSKFAIDSTNTTVKFITLGSLIKFIAPDGYGFDINRSNALTQVTSSSTAVLKSEIWAEVALFNTNGPITLNIPVPNNAIISDIIPKWKSTLSDLLVNQIVELIYNTIPFGLRYDISSLSWKIVLTENLDTLSPFSFEYEGNETLTKKDSSWLLFFYPMNDYYKVQYRGYRYIFESETQIRFQYDASTNASKKDIINIMGINTKPTNTSYRHFCKGGAYSKIIKTSGFNGIEFGGIVGGFGIDQNTHVVNIDILNNEITLSKQLLTTVFNDLYFQSAGRYSYNNDFNWNIVSAYTGIDGYVDTKKIIISFTDLDKNGVIDNPEMFNMLVEPTINAQSKFIVLEKYSINLSHEDYRYINNDSNIVIIKNSQSDLISLHDYTDGQYFYFINTNVVKKLDLAKLTLVPTLDYQVLIGRDRLKFQYLHYTNYDVRIDPSASNLIDVYVLTEDYDISFRQWVNGILSEKPTPPTSNELYTMLAPPLNLIKTMSDEIVYHSASYTVLFGSKAIPELQATFKIVKTPGVVASDNQLKSKAIIAIDTFFAIQNWDFGDTFYFTELATYVTNQLSPLISNFVIVPKYESLSFGNLFEITSESDQVFVNGATVDDIEIIAGITSSNIKSSINRGI